MILENDLLYIDINPELGGKIVSFYEKQQDFQLTAQMRETDKNTKPGLNEDFGRYAYGMDDTYPNIDEETFQWENRELHYPNHGEIWSKCFEAERIQYNQIRLYWYSEAFQYDYEKTYTLIENRLNIQYIIRNNGNSFPDIWTWHGLLRYEPDMYFVFPKGIKHVRNVLDSPLIGRNGKEYSLYNSSYDFCQVPSPDTCSMVKYYGIEKVQEGKCSVVYPTQKMKCSYYYDEKELPYLGVWITAGGLDGAYNCALEPSSGFYDRISIAQKEDKLPVLESGQERRFSFAIELHKI